MENPVVREAAAFIMDTTPEVKAIKSDFAVPRSALEAGKRRVTALCNRLFEYCESDPERYQFLMQSIISSPEPFKTLEATARMAEEGTLVVSMEPDAASPVETRAPKGYNRKERRALAKKMKRRKS